MLKKLLNKKTKKLWAIVIGAIVTAFVLGGFIGGAARSRKEPAYVGKIFGRKISFLEYKDALEATKNQAIIQFGDNFTEVQKYLNLESQAWERLILVAEAKKRKINVTNQEVVELIESYPFFQRKGRFDNQIYSEMLKYVFRTQPRIFEEQSRQNLMLAKLYNKLTDSLNLSEEEIKEEYSKSNEELSVLYIAALPSDFIKDITIIEEETKDYFAKNSLEFKRPLSFNLEYISLELDNKDEKELEDKIKKMLSRLNKREEFNKVANDFNLNLKETHPFSQTDPIPGIGWAPQILNLISKLKIGQYLPVKMDKYYYILKLKERKESDLPDFDEIKDRVKETLIKNKAQALAREKIENCLKELKEIYSTNPKSIDFAKFAKIYGLKSDSTGLFKYGSYIEGIGASDAIWTIAQGLKEDAFSEIIDMGLTGFYVIKLKSRVPIDDNKFQSEKEAFTKKLLSQKKQEYFVKFIEELKRQAQINLP